MNRQRWIVDAELMLGTLVRAGARAVDHPGAADCLVVNTCAFIERAKTESIDAILELAEWKAKQPGRRLVVTGCLSQRYGAALLGELPEIDAILGTGDLNRVVDVVRELEDEGRIGSLYGAYLVTAGNGTSVANAHRFGVEWAADLRHSGARAAILTST